MKERINLFIRRFNNEFGSSFFPNGHLLEAGILPRIIVKKMPFLESKFGGGMEVMEKCSPISCNFYQMHTAKTESQYMTTIYLHMIWS